MPRTASAVGVGLILWMCLGHPVVSANPLTEVRLVTSLGRGVGDFPEGRPDGGRGRKDDAMLAACDDALARCTGAVLVAPGTYRYNCYAFALRPFLEGRGAPLGWLNRPEAMAILHDEYVQVPASEAPQAGDVVDFPASDHLAVATGAGSIVAKWSEQGVFEGALDQQPAEFLARGPRVVYRARCGEILSLALR